jgi:hypothetical protein
VIPVQQAIDRLTAVLAPPSSAPRAPRLNRLGETLERRAGSGSPLIDRDDRIFRDRLLRATERAAVAGNKTARILTNADRGGALSFTADADTPIPVTGA